MRHILRFLTKPRSAVVVAQQVAILLLPLVAGVVLFLGLTEEERNVTSAVSAAATVLAIWAVALSAQLVWRSSNQHLLVQLHANLQPSEITNVLTIIGEMYNDEIRAFHSNKWRIWDSVGLRYLNAKNADKSLHSNRRKLTYTYEQVCALFVHGLVTRRTALGMFSNLEARAAMFTILEEILALSISCEKYTNSEHQVFVEDWNRSRRLIFPKRATRIEVGKKNMRAACGVRLLLTNHVSQFNYKTGLFKVCDSDLFLSGEPDAKMALNLTPPCPAKNETNPTTVDTAPSSSWESASGSL